MNTINNPELDKLYSDLLSDNAYFDKHNINEINNNGSSLLAKAALYGYKDLVQLLIKFGINTNIINENNYSASTFAATDEIFEIILEHQEKSVEILFSLLHERSSMAYQHTTFNKVLSIFKNEIINLDKDKLSMFVINIYANKNEDVINMWNYFQKEHNFYFTQPDAIIHVLKNIEKIIPHTITNEEINSNDLKSYKDLKTKMNDFLSQLELILKEKNKELTEKFLKSFHIENNDFFTRSYQNIHLQQYQIESCFIRSSIRYMKTTKINEDGVPSYFLDHIDYSRFNQLWYKSFQPSLDPESIAQYENLLNKYRLAGLSIDKSYKKETVLFSLDEALKKTVNIFDIKDNQLGIGKLNIRIIPCDENNFGFSGSYAYQCNTITMNCETIFRRKLLDFDENDYVLIKEFKSTFMHEYTHFLQYLDSDNYNIIKNKFSTIYQHAWNHIMNTVENIKYDKKDYHAKLLRSIDYFILDEHVKKSIIDIANHFINDLEKPQLEFYIKKIDDLTVNKDDSVYIERVKFFFISIYEAIHQQSSFHKNIWKLLDQNQKQPYYQKEIEIHARLVQEMLADDNSYSPVKLNLKNEKIKSDLKLQLSKFNALMFSHSESFNKFKKQIKPS